MGDTTELKALRANEVMVTLKGHTVNRVPCAAYIRFDVADDGVTVRLQGNPWDHRVRRVGEYSDEVPSATKKAALAHAQTLVEAWVSTPDGAYALLHAEAEWRERLLREAHGELAKANEAVKDAKLAVAAAKKERSAACKARRKLWDKQHPNYPNPEPGSAT